MFPQISLENLRRPLTSRPEPLVWKTVFLVSAGSRLEPSKGPKKILSDDPASAPRLPPQSQKQLLGKCYGSFKTSAAFPKVTHKKGRRPVGGKAQLSLA